MCIRLCKTVINDRDVACNSSELVFCTVLRVCSWRLLCSCGQAPCQIGEAVGGGGCSFWIWESEIVDCLKDQFFDMIGL